jgi:hypothetical protein
MPASQTLPQLPQLFLSTLVFVQLPRPASTSPHIWKPPGQAHIELIQISPAPHCFPHAPQLAGLFVTLVQTGGMPQSVVFAGHAQAPPMQTVPPVQAMPHPPQLFGSVFVSTQAPVQSVVPAGHMVVQVIAQTCIEVHIVPQPPQFCGSVFVSTQTPPQSVPTAQPHMPPLQTCPPTHLVPHPPQLFGSLLVFTHAPPHMTCMVGHPVFVQAPATQA